MSVKELRNKLGYSQEGLATVSGVALRTIQRIENGETIPQERTLLKLAKALEVNVIELKIAPNEKELKFLKRMTVMANVLYISPILSILVMLVTRGTNSTLSTTAKKHLNSIIISQSLTLLLFMTSAFYAMNYASFSSNFNMLKAILASYIIAYGLMLFINLQLLNRLKKSAIIK